MNNRDVNLDDEIALHDKWAESTNVDEIDVESCMNGINAPENKFLAQAILKQFGTFEGIRLLDVGCGLGESSVFFAKQGCKVTATDLSPGMIDFCQRLAARHGVSHNLEGIVGTGEDIPACKDKYQVIYAANVLHHLPDADLFLKMASEHLTDDGLFLSYDPLVGNPAIMLYRVLATKVRTDDEAPLKIGFINTVAKHFNRVEHREFWLFAQLLFIKFFLVDGIKPNDARYWKLIHQPKKYPIMKRLHTIDRFFLSLPGLRHWAWNIAIIAKRT